MTKCIFNGLFMNYNESTGTLTKVEESDVQDGTVELPLGVKIIAAKAFEKVNNVTLVVLPNSITEVHEDAFWSCKNLQEIRFEKKDTGIMIQEYAFYNLPKLEKVTLPHLESIGERPLFLACPNLREVILATPSLYFSQDIFSPSDEIKKIVLPESIRQVFYYSLESLKQMSIAIDTQSEEEFQRIKNLFPEEVHNNIYIYNKPSPTCANFFFNALLGLAAVSGAALCVTALMVFSMPLSLVVAAAGVACTVAASIGLFAINKNRGTAESPEPVDLQYQPA